MTNSLGWNLALKQSWSARQFGTLSCTTLSSLTYLSTTNTPVPIEIIHDATPFYIPFHIPLRFAFYILLISRDSIYIAPCRFIPHMCFDIFLCPWVSAGGGRLHLPVPLQSWGLYTLLFAHEILHYSLQNTEKKTKNSTIYKAITHLHMKTCCKKEMLFFQIHSNSW